MNHIKTIRFNTHEIFILTETLEKFSLSAAERKAAVVKLSMRVADNPPCKAPILLVCSSEIVNLALQLPFFKFLTTTYKNNYLIIKIFMNYKYWRLNFLIELEAASTNYSFINENSN